MFAKAFLNGQRNMVESKSDLDRLRFMPQKIEAGVVVDFKGNTIFKDIDSKDIEIFDADRINNTKRCSSALIRDYFTALDSVMHLFNNGAGGDTEETTEPTKEYGADLIECVANGDKKGIRALLKDYQKNKWSGLNAEDVEDAIFDLNDCTSDKDVEGAKEILSDLICDDICEVKTEEKKEAKATEPKSSHEPANEDEAELLQDLEEAVEDKDWEDVELLLKELGNKHARYAEFEAKLPGVDKEETQPEPNTKSEDQKVLDEICDDIDDALEAKDSAKAKDFLEELGEEAGADSDIYKEYKAKVNPPKERTRRSRRG